MVHFWADYIRKKRYIDSLVILIIIILIVKGICFLSALYHAKVWEDSSITQGQIVSRYWQRPDGCREKSKKYQCRPRLHLIAQYKVNDYRYKKRLDESLMDRWPLARYISVGARFDLYYQNNAPEIWKPVFEFNSDAVKNHIQRLQGMPKLTEAVIKIDPVVPSQSNNLGYLPIHFSYQFLTNSWIEKGPHPALNKPDKFDTWSCFGGKIKLDEVEAGQKFLNFKRGGNGSISDRMLIMPEVVPGQTMELSLFCYDSRLTHDETIILTSILKVPRTNTPQLLGPADFSVTFEKRRF